MYVYLVISPEAFIAGHLFMHFLLQVFFLLSLHDRRGSRQTS